MKGQLSRWSRGYAAGVYNLPLPRLPGHMGPWLMSTHPEHPSAPDLACGCTTMRQRAHGHGLSCGGRKLHLAGRAWESR